MTNSNNNETVSEMRLRYEKITKEAFEVALKAPIKDERVRDVFNMVQSYIADAEYFALQGNEMRAVAALSYAHGWLDCAARAGFFEVYDDRLFTVDSKEVKKD